MLIYLAEGQTEQKLLESLKSCSRVKPAQVIVFNIFTQRIKSLRQLPPNAPGKKVCIVFDLDVLSMVNTNSQAQLTCFHDNMSNLRARGYRNILLLQQADTLEDELHRSCKSCATKQDFFKAFNVSGATKFKSEFLKANDILTILDTLGFDINAMWKKPYHGNLEKYVEFFGSGADISN